MYLPLNFPLLLSTESAWINLKAISDKSAKIRNAKRIHKNPCNFSHVWLLNITQHNISLNGGNDCSSSRCIKRGKINNYVNRPFAHQIYEAISKYCLIKSVKQCVIAGLITHFYWCWEDKIFGKMKELFFNCFSWWWDHNLRTWCSRSEKKWFSWFFSASKLSF